MDGADFVGSHDTFRAAKLKGTTGLIGIRKGRGHIGGTAQGRALFAIQSVSDARLR